MAKKTPAKKAPAKKTPAKKPLTYKQLVQKVTKDKKFARMVHGLVCKTRSGDKEAAKKLQALVTITDKELEQCCLPPNLLNLLDCGHNKNFTPFRTATTTLLLDFAAMAY
jgi:hypothetical protein